MATIDTISELLHDNLGIDPSSVQADSTFDTLGIDSLDLVELICELEDRLDIDFGEPDGIDTVADLVDYIDSL